MLASLEAHLNDFAVPPTDLAVQAGNEGREDDLVTPAVSGVVRLVVGLEDLPEADLEEDEAKAVDVKGLAVGHTTQRSRVAVEGCNGRIARDDRKGSVEIRARGVEAGEEGGGDLRDKGGGGGWLVSRLGDGRREEEDVRTAERLVQPVERVEGPQGYGEGLGKAHAVVEVGCLEVWRRDERVQRGEGRLRRLVDEAVAVVGGVVGVAHAVDAVQVRVAFRRRVHHAGEVVEAAHVGNALLDSLAVIVHPLNDDVAGRLVMGLAAPAVGGLGDVQRRPGHLERKGRLEGRLRLRVEVDA